MKYLFLTMILLSKCIQASFIRHAYHEYQAHKAYKQKKYDKAMSIYSSMLQDDAYNPVINYNLGIIFYEKKQFETAQHYFNRAAGYSKNSKLKEMALFDYANALYHQKLLEQALAAYKKVLELNSDNKKAQQNIEYVKQLLEQKKQEQESDQNQSNDKESNDKQGDNNQLNSDNSQKDKNKKQKNDNQSSQEEQNQNNDNKKNDQLDQQKSEKSGNTKNSKQNRNIDEKNNTNDEQDTSKDLKKSEKNPKDQQNEQKSALHESAQDQKKSIDSKDQSNNSDLKKDESAQQPVMQQDESNRLDQSDPSELTDAYAKDVLQDSDDKRLDKHGIAVMQSVAQQEENMQKAVLKMNVSKKGDVQSGQKNW